MAAWPSQYRALLSSVTDFDAFSKMNKDLSFALRCTMKGCTSCAEFESEGRRDFERSLGCFVLPFPCDNNKNREFALKCGVDDLPSYIVYRKGDRALVTPELHK